MNKSPILGIGSIWFFFLVISALFISAVYHKVLLVVLGHLNSIALRKAKIVCNFGLSECSRIKPLIFHLGQKELIFICFFGTKRINFHLSQMQNLWFLGVPIFRHIWVCSIHYMLAASRAMGPEFCVQNRFRVLVMLWRGKQPNLTTD